MNERLLELAKQAGFEITPWRDELLPCVHQEGPIDIELEKFAELIVGKCIDICKEQANIVSQKYGPASLNMSFMANDCAQAIKEHFKE